MENQVIKNISYEKTGKRIIKYFKSLGVDTREYSGIISEENKSISIYYGVINGKFDIYTLEVVQDKNAKIIELPEVFEPKRGDKVMVWDYDESNAVERIFLTEIKGTKYPIITIDVNDEHKFLSDGYFSFTPWIKMKPISTNQIVELTLEDISNGKGVGVKPELIRIKK